MKPKVLLRIAAALMFLHTLGHSMGALNWQKGPNKTIQQVIDAMLANHFLFMGASRSIGNFYEGYGISMIFVLLLITFILWTLSTEAAVYPKPVAKLLLPIALFLLVLSIVEIVYFFPFAAVISFLSAVCTFTGMILLLKQNNLMK